MKKIFALLLAIVMVMGLATVVSAEDPTTIEMKSEEVDASIVIEKMYELVGSKDASLFPDEVLTFKSTPASGNPDQTNLILSDIDVNGNVNQKLGIKLPEYTKVGEYAYTISENTTKEMQGVEYTTGSIDVKVLVTYDYTDADQDGYGLESAIYLVTKAADKSATTEDKLLTDGKVDTFVNKYNVGHLTVSKTVSGNLASTTQYFDFTVVFTSAKKVASNITISGGSDPATMADTAIEVSDWTGDDTNGYTYTHTFKLKDTDTLKFDNIPNGVTYVVTEDGKHADADANGTDSSKGYTATPENTTGAIATNDTKAASVNNHKNKEVETGIVMDSVPFVVMAVIAVLGLAAFTAKKRVQE